MVYRKYIIFFNIVLILCVSGKTNAQILSLEEAEKEVLENNPDIGAAEFRQKAAEERIPQVEALEDPMIGVEFYNTPIDTIDITRSEDIDFKIRQNIPFPGKLRTHGNVARNDARLVEEKERTQIQDILYDLRMSYYDMWALDHLLAINKKNQEIVREILESFKISYATGKTTLDASLKQEIEASKLRNEEIVLTSERNTHRAHLRALLGSKTHEVIDLPNELTKPNLHWTVEELQEIAANERPELHILDAQIKRDDSHITEVTQNLIPDFSFGFAYKENPAGKNLWAFEAMVNVPIFFWSKNRAEIREAEMLKKVSEQERSSLHFHTYHEIEEAYTTLRALDAIIASYEKEILPKSKTNLIIAKTAYETNKIDFITLREAERSYHELEIPYYEAQGNFGKSQARLERILGKRLEDL